MSAIPPFKLERYFAQYEFKVRYLLSASDCESLTLRETLDLADPECLALWERLSFSYTESAGHPLLRAEVARLYPSLAPEDVLILTPEEGIFIALQTLLEPGDHVIAIAPAYQSLHELVRANGCALTLWPLTPTGSGWQLDLDLLARSFTSRTRLLILNFPHNPTGYLPPRAEWDAILDLARQHNVMVFSDEMYRGLEFDSAERLPALCEVYENGVSLSGVSKTYSAPGLRIGWLATRQQEWMERWLTFKDYTTICHSAPSEVLALMVLRARESIAARNVARVRANAQSVAELFGQYPQLFHWLPPRAGSIAFPQWRGPQSIERFCQSILDEQGVMIVPGSLFDYPGGYFRVGLGRANFPEALERVEVYLNSL